MGNWSTGRLVRLALILGVAMIATHWTVWRLDYHVRPYVFGVVSILFVFWPVLYYFVPRFWLPAMLMVPLVGVTLSMVYVGDIGTDKYFFEATPPCCTGIWAIAASAQIVYGRIRKMTPEGGDDSREDDGTERSRPSASFKP